MNLGEEVILTLLWQSGASESVTVCFVISLSICYWLFKCGVLHVVCVCVCVYVRLCVWERERGSQRSVVCVLVMEILILSRDLFIFSLFTKMIRSGSFSDHFFILHKYASRWRKRVSYVLFCFKSTNVLYLLVTKKMIWLY